MAWPKGKQLQGGKYVIERVLGIGGFGITYLAKTSNGQLYAIKTVNETVESSRDFEKCQRDFFNEVRRLEKCRHQYIVRIEEVIQDGPLSCLVMEYLPGENLKDKVENGGVLSEAEALRHIRQIGEALIEVHNKGLLHRDVKHENIMLRGNESEAVLSEAVLIDFGIAREFTPDVTQSHTEKLSDGFAPIEQYFRKGKRGECTDVYGLAATLYFLLTGQRPITALDRDAEIRDGRKDSLVPPKRLNRRISDSVNKAILQGMALEVKDRPQSMREWLRLVSLIWEPGDKLHRGKYTIENVLGNEDFIRTYLASDKNGKRVVIKTLNEVAQRRHDFTKLQQNLLKKAKRLKKCKHLHLARVYKVFKQGLLWCMVMEYIDGENLASYVANQGALPEVKALRYIQQISEGLIALHNNRLLHLDVKPANIMLRNGGYEAVLIGFCIAREFTADGTLSDDATLKESVIVADSYAASEQYFKRGKKGAYTDVYGLAATLYFLLTGEVPPPGIDRLDDGGPVLQKQLNQGISDWVNKAIIKGIALEGKDRPGSIREWLKLLEEPKAIGKLQGNNHPKLSSILEAIVGTSIEIGKVFWGNSIRELGTRSIPWGCLSVVCICHSFIYLYLNIYILSILLGFFILFRISMYINNLSKKDESLASFISITHIFLIPFYLVYLSRVFGTVLGIFMDDKTLTAPILDWALKQNDVLVLTVIVTFLPVLIWTVFRASASASEELQYSFSWFHTFVILAGTSGLGLGLGWLLAQIFP